jgi:DNA polymerase III epsilon subunit-like protein
VEEEALAVNGINLADCTMTQAEMVATLKNDLSLYVNKFDRQDKAVMLGYNVGFDERFLRAAFERQRDKYFGSWFFWPKVDVAGAVAREVLKRGLRLPNYKLETVCGHFGVKIDAHDALSDIKATVELWRRLEEVGAV